MKMVTNKELTYKTRGGLPFIVPKGSEVEYRADIPCYFIKPNQFNINSIAYHDATYHGIVVTTENVEFINT